MCQEGVGRLVPKLSHLGAVLWVRYVLLPLHEEVYLKRPEVLCPRRRVQSSLPCYLEPGDRMQGLQDRQPDGWVGQVGTAYLRLV